MDQEELKKKLSPIRLVIPIAIGLSVVGYLFYREFDPSVMDQLEPSATLFWGILGIFILVMLRFVGYIWRLRILTDQELNWRQSFEVIVLWSFASAISPSAVGGTALAIFILNKENINIGKSTTIAITTLLLDLSFFVIFSLAMYFILGEPSFFGNNQDCGDQIGIQNIFGSYKAFFFIVMGGIILYLLLVFYAVFINPNTIRALFQFIFSFKYLRRFKNRALKAVDDLEESSFHLRSKSWMYWVGLFITTMLAWSSRFFLVNPVVASFVELDYIQHITIYARNFVLWMVMIMPTTPGASGVSEIAMSELICEFMPHKSLSPLIIFIWRVFDYFIYLFLGMIVLPRWISRVFKRR